MFRRLKGFRRIGTRYDKLDLMSLVFIYLALCIIVVHSLTLYSVNRPQDFAEKIADVIAISCHYWYFLISLGIRK
jgi:hypothetical protein